MEYCEANKSRLEQSLMGLKGAMNYRERNRGKWTLYYDDSWSQVQDANEAIYIIEIYVEGIQYTYGDIKDIILQAYEIKGNNNPSILVELKGNCLIRQGEA